MMENDETRAILVDDVFYSKIGVKVLLARSLGSRDMLLSQISHKVFSSDRVVNIHPFKNAVGRMCRLILNAIVIEYAGMVVSFRKRRCG